MLAAHRLKVVQRQFVTYRPVAEILIRRYDVGEVIALMHKSRSDADMGTRWNLRGLRLKQINQVSRVRNCRDRRKCTRLCYL